MIIKNVVIRGGLDTTVAYFTDANLERDINTAYQWASSYKRWPMIEYMDKSGAFTSGTEEYSYPNTGFKTDSIRTMKIGDYLFKKIAFTDYLKWRENYTSNDDRIFSDYRRTLYINPNCVSGTIYAYGALAPSSLSTSTATTIFSTDVEGDDAIVDKTLEYCFQRSKQFELSTQFKVSAIQKLEELWKRLVDEQSGYQSKDRPMFDRIDIVNGDYYNDENNPLRF